MKKGTCPVCGTNAVVLKGKNGVCGDCLFNRIKRPENEQPTPEGDK